MIIDPQTNKSNSLAKNWALMGDFIHTSKSIVKPVIYQEVPLTNEQRADNLLKQFSRFGINLSTPELYAISRKYVIECINDADENEKNGTNYFTMNHVKNGILEMLVKTTPLRIVT